MNGVDSKILVVTASGLLGSTLTKQLLDERELPVHAFVRPSSRTRIDALVARGAVPVLGDLKDRDSLQAACHGVDTVISAATAVVSQQPGDSIDTVDLTGQLNLIEAAEKAGVRRFIYISILEQDEDFPLQTAKRAVEARLAQSTVLYTILRPTFFQEVWLSPPLGFDFVEGHVRVFGNGDNRQNWISVSDVSRTVMHCMAAPETVGKTLDLYGPESLSVNQVITLFEAVSGRPYVKEYVSEEFLKAQYSEASEPRQKSFFALAIQCARDAAPRVSTNSSVPTPVATVSEYANLVLKAS